MKKFTVKEDLAAAKRITAPAWQRIDDRKRLILLARQLYHAGLIPHDIDELLSRIDREPQNPFEMMFLNGRRPTSDDINWEALESVVMRYFPGERPKEKE
jgi:hypothetical protein